VTNGFLQLIDRSYNTDQSRSQWWLCTWLTQ